MKLPRNKLVILAIIVVIVLAVIGYKITHQGYGDAFISGNGRIEATEINLASKYAGRIESILVHEGDFVNAGQHLALMQTEHLQAQLDEAKAQHQQAITAETSANAQIKLRESDKQTAEANVAQQVNELNAAERRLKRAETLFKKQVLSEQEYDDHQTRVESAKAAVQAANAKVSVANATIDAARAQAVGAQAAIKATEASIHRIETDIQDSILIAPRDGRVQYIIGHAGEVIGAGGRVLNLVDLSDVYMTFFLPETAAGRVALGQDVRIILDAAPEFIIPANISYVASTAQFTPKTVETESERQKLMFRVKAKLPPSLLKRYLTQVKTGLPGVAWLKLDPNISWPEALQINIENEGK